MKNREFISIINEELKSKGIRNDDINLEQFRDEITKYIKQNLLNKKDSK